MNLLFFQYFSNVVCEIPKAPLNIPSKFRYVSNKQSNVSHPSRFNTYGARDKIVDHFSLISSNSCLVIFLMLD